MTDVKGSLAQHLSNVADKLGGGKNQKKKASLPKSSPASDKPADALGLTSSPAAPPTGTTAGVFSSDGTSRTSIVNGSHHSLSADDETHETVLVLPDYVAITNVPATADGAESLWLHALAPEVLRAGAVRGAQGLQTWTLPYHCLILLCTHPLFSLSPTLRVASLT